MSNDTNYIRPDHNAAVLEPLPELDSDELYREQRKAREAELWNESGYMSHEAILDSIDDEFLLYFRAAFIDKCINSDTQSNLTLAINSLFIKVVDYVEKQAKEDVDNG